MFGTRRFFLLYQLKPLTDRSGDVLVKRKIIHTAVTWTESTGSSAAFSHWLTHHFGLDEVTDNLVVEVIDGSPLDPLLNVFFLQRQKNNPILFEQNRREPCDVIRSHLLCLERELDENLLQLLVDKVDAELLEAVSLKEDRQELVRVCLKVTRQIFFLQLHSSPHTIWLHMNSRSVLLVTDCELIELLRKTQHSPSLRVIPGRSQSRRCRGRQC